MSGLDTYLSTLFREFEMRLPVSGNQLPAVYGDGIFPQLSAVIASYRDIEFGFSAIDTRMASVWQSIEHVFAVHSKIFALLYQAEQSRVLVLGDHVKMMIIIFFLMNCYNCMNEHVTNFDIYPRLLE